MPITTKEIERLVAVETKLDTLIDQQKDLLTEIKGMSVAYVPRVELIEWRRAGDEEHRAIRADLVEQRKQFNNRLKTYRTVVIAVATTLIGGFAAAFFKLILKV